MITIEFNRTDETDEQFGSRVAPAMNEFFDTIGEPAGTNRVFLQDVTDAKVRRITCIFEWPIIT